MQDMAECKIIHSWMRFTSNYRRLEQKIEGRIHDKTGLCLNDFYLLYYLCEKPDHKMRIQDACRYVQMSQSALSRLVKRLEDYEKPILSRSICLEDKRAVYIGLTDAGKELFNSIIKDIADILLEFREVDFRK